MRRNRMRSYTIDAENEEEFIQEYEKMKKSRLSQLNFEEKEKENKNKRIEETEEEDLLSFHKPKNTINSNINDDEDEYSGLGGFKVEDDDEEDNLGKDNYDEDDILKESEDDLIKKENNEEKGIELLYYYLKNSISEISNGKIKNNKDSIFYKNNKNIKALSGNAIYDLNIRDLVDNILAENDNEYIKPSENNNNSLLDYIFQNIESDNNIKIMFMSNNKSTKNSFVNKFFGINNININKEENFDEPFVIRKKYIKLFNKNINLQMLDTSDEFHRNSISSVYYKNVSAFFIFIEASNHKSKKYLDFIIEKIDKFIYNKTVVIFGINMLFKKDCTIDNINLREYANEKNVMFIPIKINDFDMKNSLIINLLNLILIKSIDSKSSKDSLRKTSNHRKLGGYKKKLVNKINDSSQKNILYDITKMNITSCLGYKKKYRIKHINAFDIEDNNEKFIRRKLSIDF
jgi:hypothetical protein